MSFCFFFSNNTICNIFEHPLLSTLNTHPTPTHNLTYLTLHLHPTHTTLPPPNPSKPYLPTPPHTHTPTHLPPSHTQTPIQPPIWCRWEWVRVCVYILENFWNWKNLEKKSHKFSKFFVIWKIDNCTFILFLFVKSTILKHFTFHFSLCYNILSTKLQFTFIFLFIKTFSTSKFFFSEQGIFFWQICWL